MNQNALTQQGGTHLHESQYKSIQLPDGRRLGFAEYGVPNGKVVLFFHGSPGSSIIHADMVDAAAKLSIRLIAPDRPGYGLSDAHAGRTMLGWADDIAALVDALGIDRFSIIGFSGGSPYPLACAYRLPERVTKVALVAALAPLDAPGVMDGMSPMVKSLYELAHANPDELRTTFAAIAPTPGALAGAMSASAGSWDQKIMQDRAAEFELEYAQTLLGGTEGVASDFILASGIWGFPLDRITNEVYLWTGTADENAPPAMTHYLATQLSNSRTIVLPGEGHFALYQHWEEILERLM